MTHPSQMFSRIRAQRARPTPGTRGAMPPPVAPAPVAPPAPPFPPLASPAMPPADESPAVSRRPAGHALYSQVMRRHDRAGGRR